MDSVRVEKKFANGGVSVDMFTLDSGKKTDLERFQDKVKSLNVPSQLEKAFSKAGDTAFKRISKSKGIMPGIHFLGSAFLGAISNVFKGPREKALEKLVADRVAKL